MQVLSSNGKTFYEVTPNSCTCPDFRFRQAGSGGRCKHMIKCFSPQQIEFGKDKIDFFKDGVSVADALEKYNEIDVKSWISYGYIAKIFRRGKWYYFLLE